MKFLTDENRKKIVDVLFYVALTIELVLMIVEKSEITFSYESYVFRVTFLLTFLAVLVMKHDKKEWIAIALLLAFTGLCYYLSGKNDLLRLATFLMAARDIDLKKAMKYSFYVCAVGFLIIVVLACAGIMGDITLTYDYGRDAGLETRYVFGFGHPNTLFSSVYALFIMWIWIYGRKAGIIPYAAVSVATVFVSVIAKTRTGLAVVVVTIVVAALFRIFPKLGELKVMYILETLVSPIFCVVSAIVAAAASDYQYLGPGHTPGNLYWKIDIALNFRMSNLYYETTDRGGTLSRWKLFAGHGSESYFDMGWVRLFYWYGIIPTALIVIAIFAVIYICYKKKDIWTMVLIFSLSVYTIVEATFVTRYFGRDFFLLIAGVYLGYYFRNKGELDVG